MDIESEITELAREYAIALQEATDKRVAEMENDDKSHFLIYQVLGITNRQGHLIDVYQNKGRFLYRYAGAFLEEATKRCFKHRYPESQSVKIPNTQGQHPKTFEIDCLINSDAIEIKWRDATTDGDHITKEHTRVQAVVDAGFTPIRVMFFYPNRTQAMRIQKTLETLYLGVNGEYYYANSAWTYVRDRTGIDLKAIMERIAKENTSSED